MSETTDNIAGADRSLTRVLAHLFDVLARICPFEFQRSYGASMRHDFCAIIDGELRAHRLAAALCFAIAAYGDIVSTALGERTAMVARDLTFAWRTLRQTPLFALVIIATLAIAIAANATAFSILRPVVFAPLPYPHADRLVAVLGTRDGLPFDFSLPDFRDIRRASHSLASLGAFDVEHMNLSGRGAPHRIVATRITQGFFETLGVRPERGRLFDASDEGAGAAKAVVIADRLWHTELHADPAVIGAPIVLDGVEYRIVGVAPPAFVQPGQSDNHDLIRADVWVLVPFAAVSDPNYNRGAHYFSAVGRLRDDVDIPAARAEINAIFTRLVAQYPDTDKHYGAGMTSLTDQIVGNIRPALWAIFAAVGGVLLVACANVSNLLLSRGATRDRELAVRAALGATRGRIVAQLLTETLAFTFAGAVLGVAGSALALRAFVDLRPAGIPRLDTVHFDLCTVAFTLGLIGSCTVLAGCAPAFALSRREAITSLKSAGRSGDASAGRRSRALLVVAEIAFTLALVVGAGLIVRSFIALIGEAIGFSAARVVTIGPIELPDRRFSTDARINAYRTAVLKRVHAVPGVERVAWACCGPFMHEGFSANFAIVGRQIAPGDAPTALVNSVSADYFALLGIPLRAGRVFTERDRAGAANVIIVNAAFARRHFTTGAVLGARITFGGGSPGHPAPLRTIVGIVGDVRDSYARAQAPMLYLPDAQIDLDASRLFVKVTSPNVADTVAAAVAKVDPELPAPAFEPLDAALERDAAPARLSAIVLATLGIVALALSVAGVFAVVSYGVAARTHEFGIRMALGARASRIVGDVLGGAMRNAAIGIVAGLVIAGGATRLLADQLYGITALDPSTFCGVTLIIVLASLAAALLPARRATRVDPAIALRCE